MLLFLLCNALLVFTSSAFICNRHFYLLHLPFCLLFVVLFVRCRLVLSSRKTERGACPHCSTLLQSKALNRDVAQSCPMRSGSGLFRIEQEADDVHAEDAVDEENSDEGDETAPNQPVHTAKVNSSALVQSDLSSSLLPSLGTGMQNSTPSSLRTSPTSPIVQTSATPPCARIFATTPSLRTSTTPSVRASAMT